MAGEFLFGVFAGDGTAQMLTVDTKHSTSTISELSPEQKFLFYYRYRQPPRVNSITQNLLHNSLT